MSQRVETRTDLEATTSTVPAPLVWTSLGLALAGLAVSSYLTYEHYTGSTSLACPESGKVDCAKVTTSRYADALGVPVAVLGLGFFVVVLLLCLPAAWRSPTPLLRLARVGLAGAGVAMVVYLVWAELYRIGAICLWCTGVHALTLLIFAVVVFAEALREPERREPAATLGRP